MSEESYVVRIYRKQAPAAPADAAQCSDGGRRRYDRMKLIGVVELVERGERRAFHDIEELWTILAAGEPRRDRH